MSVVILSPHFPHRLCNKLNLLLTKAELCSLIMFIAVAHGAQMLVSASMIDCEGQLKATSKLPASSWRQAGIVGRTRCKEGPHRAKHTLLWARKGQLSSRLAITKVCSTTSFHLPHLHKMPNCKRVGRPPCVTASSPVYPKKHRSIFWEYKDFLSWDGRRDMKGSRGIPRTKWGNLEPKRSPCYLILKNGPGQEWH